MTATEFFVYIFSAILFFVFLIGAREFTKRTNRLLDEASKNLLKNNYEKSKKFEFGKRKITRVLIDSNSGFIFILNIELGSTKVHINKINLSSLLNSEFVIRDRDGSWGALRPKDIKHAQIVISLNSIETPNVRIDAIDKGTEKNVKEKYIEDAEDLVGILNNIASLLPSTEFYSEQSIYENKESIDLDDINPASKKTAPRKKLKKNKPEKNGLEFFRSHK